jgi:hypothetical protein
VIQSRAARWAAAISASDISLAISRRSRAASALPRMAAMLNHLWADTISAGTEAPVEYIMPRRKKSCAPATPDGRLVATRAEAALDIVLCPVSPSFAPAATVGDSLHMRGAREIQVLSISRILQPAVRGGRGDEITESVSAELARSDFTSPSGQERNFSDGIATC